MYLARATCILFAVATATVEAIAVAIARDAAITAPIKGYGVEHFTTEVEAFPGGPKANYTGTVNEVISQLTAINPQWKSDFNISDVSSKPLQKRQLPFPFTSVLCDVNINEWGYVNSAETDIVFLENFPGTPTLGPGPGNCGQVACSGGTAVWWCNDETETFSLPNYATIGLGAEAVQDTCEGSSHFFNGQIFAQFLQNWNVIVRFETC